MANLLKKLGLMSLATGPVDTQTGRDADVVTQEELIALFGLYRKPGVVISAPADAA